MAVLRSRHPRTGHPRHRQSRPARARRRRAGAVEDGDHSPGSAALARQPAPGHPDRGLLWSQASFEVFVGFSPSGRLSPIQVHVGAALVAVPLLAWHVLRHRRQRLGRVDLSRRNLLRTGAFAVGVIAGYLGIEAVGRAAGLPSASRIATGSHQLDPQDAPATIWLFDQVPVVSDDHRVDVAGRC